jgi:hypothetical protein
VADIALVPQSGVLQRGHQVSTDHASKAADALGEDRVAFVRHRRAPLLLFAKRFERFTNLASLQVPDLGCDPLERPGREGKRRHEVRVPVTRYDLGRDSVRLEAELFADVILDLGVDRGVSADRATHPSDGCVVGGTSQALARAIELRHPTGNLEAEGDRLRHDAVGPPGH